MSETFLQSVYSLINIDIVEENPFYVVPYMKEVAQNLKHLVYHIYVQGNGWNEAARRIECIFGNKYNLNELAVNWKWAIQGYLTRGLPISVSLSLFLVTCFLLSSAPSLSLDSVFSIFFIPLLLNRRSCVLRYTLLCRRLTFFPFPSANPPSRLSHCITSI